MSPATSVLPPLRFHHPTRVELELHYTGPERHCGGCVREDVENTVKALPMKDKKYLLSVGDQEPYVLEDVHWHTPSEHTVGGVAFPLEQHMKYMREDRSGAAEYTVVAVFVHPGQANDSLDRLLSSVRRAEHPGVRWTESEVQLDELLPSCTESYRYVGSTTVCEYTPGVRWNVLTHPVQASAAVLKHFRDLFPEGNSLDVQRLGDRRIVSDRHRWW
ncbi:carbonic anhydrase family protein [Streptomyces geranii]|uniref:carbonic anhydrase family protein n=1 Tax=Streptomyces geranii TaxID=2058923 RepID=UPI0013003C90|nr:carbonic anhydrase family protein [Streptomyces geranii]